MLILGGLYKTDFNDNPCRIIGLDEFEIFYDSIAYDGKWMVAGSLKRAVIFYRFPKEAFKLRSELIGFEELTETELQYFRPDLPMCFGRNKIASWNGKKLEEDKILQKEFGNATLNTDKIMLAPSGPGGGMKKSELLEGSPKLNVFEIIKTARGLCETHNSQSVSGIGFYRLGFQKGIPSYYIGGYIDRAGFMENK